MANAVVLVDRPAKHVARLLINRPDKRNAIDHDVRQGLMDGLSQVLGDRSTRALLLGGVGGVFSAGGDLPSMLGLNEAQARERMQHVHRLCRMVANAHVPPAWSATGPKKSHTSPACYQWASGVLHSRWWRALYELESGRLQGFL